MASQVFHLHLSKRKNKKKQKENNLFWMSNPPRGMDEQMKRRTKNPKTTISTLKRL